MIMIESQAIVSLLQQSFPNLLAVYGFGSRVSNVAYEGSDLDVAILVAGYAPPLELWDAAQTLADIAQCGVDLLDLRAASTVMQYQVITTGIRWWARDVQAGIFEAAILSEKTELDTARAGLLNVIQQRGKVYGR